MNVPNGIGRCIIILGIAANLCCMRVRAHIFFGKCHANLNSDDDGYAKCGTHL